MNNKCYKGIVLRSVKYGEHDKMLTIFTLEEGKLSAVAKGAQSTRSRLLGASQGYAFGEFVLSESLKMPYVVSADVLKSHNGLQKDIGCLCAASYVCEIMESTFEDNSEDKAAFMLLYHTLRLLEESPPDKALLIATSFALKIMGICGTYPVLNRCVGCGKEKKSYRFSVQGGGIFCSDCLEEKGFPIITASEGLYLFDLLYCEMDRLSSLTAPEERIQKYLLKQINEYLIYTLGKRIKSYEMLYQL